MPKKEVACCGAYCKTCRIKVSPLCKGCKLGYENGSRDINKAKCKIKLCCLRDKNLESCADCIDFEDCKILNEFYNKNGSKYQQYKKSLLFIRDYGYEKFLKFADNWKGPYGRLK